MEHYVISIVLAVFIAGAAGVLVDETRDEAEYHPTYAHSGLLDCAVETEKQCFSSGVWQYDAAFNLAISEMQINSIMELRQCTKADAPRLGRSWMSARCKTKVQTFIAGAGWNQLWTRDSAYTVALAGALVNPEASRVSLEKSISLSTIGHEGTLNGTNDTRKPVRKKTWTQDKCSHFGKWPHLSDAIVGAHGAWSLYAVTGDREFLKLARESTENSLIRAEKYAYENSSGLFRGCASFMESNSAYPKKYWNDGKRVFATKALSTNLLHYMAYKIAALMGKELGADKSKTDLYDKKAADLRHAIRSRFWLPNKGYYAYVLDENGVPLEQMEGLGESLVLLAPDFESDESRIQSIFQNTYRGDRGIPCLWPRFENDLRNQTAELGPAFQDSYHNGRTWPFVQGYWALAAARHGRGDVMMEEMAKLLASSQLNNTFAEFYEDDGTFPDGHHRQLWSDAGFLSMIYQGLFGMVFEPSGLRFRPIKQGPFAGTISLKNLRYRSMTLDIFLTGSGSRVVSFQLDEKSGNAKDPFLPCDLKGRHTVRIRLLA